MVMKQTITYDDFNNIGASQLEIKEEIISFLKSRVGLRISRCRLLFGLFHSCFILDWIELQQDHIIIFISCLTLIDKEHKCLF